MLKKTKHKRIIKTGLCGDWVELYEIIPRPRIEGGFFLAYRKKRKKKALPLICGITIGGAKIWINRLKKCLYDPTSMVLFIDNRLEDKNLSLVSTT